jgi:hypothetical protein
MVFGGKVTRLLRQRSECRNDGTRIARYCGCSCSSNVLSLTGEHREERFAQQPEKHPYGIIERIAIRLVAFRGMILAVAIRRIPRNGTSCSGDGARRASRRPRKQATGRPLRAVIHRPGIPARRVATPSRRRRNAADCDKFDASVSICFPQQLLGTGFSTELTSQKQSADELCEVLMLGL